MFSLRWNFTTLLLRAGQRHRLRYALFILIRMSVCQRSFGLARSKVLTRFEWFRRRDRCACGSCPRPRGAVCYQPQSSWSRAAEPLPPFGSCNRGLGIFAGPLALHTAFLLMLGMPNNIYAD